MPPLLMKNKVPGIFQMSGAQVLLRSQHLASEVYAFPRQRVGLATSDLAMRYHFIWVAFTTDGALFNTSRPSEHCVGATLADSRSRLCSHYTAHTREHGKPWLLLPRETSPAAGRLKSDFKMLRRFLQSSRILDTALNAGSS